MVPFVCMVGQYSQVRRLRREAEEEQRRRREDALARQRVRLGGLGLLNSPLLGPATLLQEYFGRQKASSHPKFLSLLMRLD